MFSEFIGQKIKYVTIDEDGEETTMGEVLTEVEGTLIKVKAPSGKVTIINTAANNFFKLELM
ncbi:hypothetical protein ACX03_15755 [Vibrio parahaemolyticus]|jgi:glycine cleavage system H lipoate-binding protein|uniref:hypothetical protein n=1 Tax=Vibrio TaxID=662 RepID=UPI0006B25F3E|nr:MULTISPECIES: hypothetical protein [Vibrio]EGR2919145.1 hypothetical protein [Vibrio parahaemolyticus]EGX7690551.1 hypothetical protein [Vibrio parahaemolyticus]KOY37922.1 hypothetical protein ACX08_04730 [Vibrio parahaemolyticus]KOY44653.1 hypothetical protein ACX03_15755 [Vibrio parahaemolyticus]MBE4368127.1 hypothetical protein [Vibrio parahaemolyticus]